jgi:hypothetical protein
MTTLLRKCSSFQTVTVHAACSKPSGSGHCDRGVVLGALVALCSVARFALGDSRLELIRVDNSAAHMWYQGVVCVCQEWVLISAGRP